VKSPGRCLTLLLALLLLPALARGEGLNLDPWTREDTWRQTAVTALLLADWYQTQWMVKNPCANAGGGTNCSDPFREDHFARYFIGSRPTVGQVNNYFAASIVAHAAIAYVLPKGWREAWQYVWIGIQIDTVRRNYIGIKYGF
jgi:hypothetical protein